MWVGEWLYCHPILTQQNLWAPLTQLSLSPSPNLAFWDYYVSGLLHCFMVWFVIFTFGKITFGIISFGIVSFGKSLWCQREVEFKKSFKHYCPILLKKYKNYGQRLKVNILSYLRLVVCSYCFVQAQRSYFTFVSTIMTSALPSVIAMKKFYSSSMLGKNKLNCLFLVRIFSLI